MLAFEICSTGAALAELLAALLRSHYPGCPVRCLDTGQADSAAIRLAGSDRWIFVATSRQPDAFMAEALANGACAVLNAASTPVEVERSFACLITDGAPYAPLTLLRWLSNEMLTPQPVTTRPKLTARERSVLALLARGYSNQEIGRELMISENTVRTHVHGLLSKFGDKSRARMLAHARSLDVPEALGQSGTPSRAVARATA